MLLTKKVILATIATTFLAACASEVSGPKAQRIEISTDAPDAGAACLLQDSKGNQYRVDPAPGAVAVLRNGGPLTITCSLEGYQKTSYVITEQARGGSSNFMGLAGGGSADSGSGTAGPWYPTVNIIEMIPGDSREIHYQQQKVTEYSPAMRTRPMSEDELAMAAEQQMAKTRMQKQDMMPAPVRPQANGQAPLVGSLAPAPTQNQVQRSPASNSPALRPIQPKPQMQAKAQPVQPIRPKPAPAPVTGGYTIQAGAFGNPANASKMADKLRRQGFGVIVEPVQRQGRTLYSVRVGYFAQSNAAKAALQTFQQRSGIKGFVVARGK